MLCDDIAQFSTGRSIDSFFFFLSMTFKFCEDSVWDSIGALYYSLETHKYHQTKIQEA